VSCWDAFEAKTTVRKTRPVSTSVVDAAIDVRRTCAATAEATRPDVSRQM
jgi:hypothetical protein